MENIDWKSMTISICGINLEMDNVKSGDFNGTVEIYKNDIGTLKKHHLNVIPLPDYEMYQKQRGYYYFRFVGTKKCLFKVKFKDDIIKVGTVLSLTSINHEIGK